MSSVTALGREIIETCEASPAGDARAAGGTGLGFYISGELTERMGGRLRVESEAGDGARFVLELPVTT